MSAREEFQHLAIGDTYKVVREFKDYDGCVHPVGETWRFLGHNFLPYDDGLSLFVAFEGDREVQIRMRWVPGDQAEIIDNLRSYVAAHDASLISRAKPWKARSHGMAR